MSKLGVCCLCDFVMHLVESEVLNIFLRVVKRVSIVLIWYCRCVSYEKLALHLLNFDKVLLVGFSLTF